MYIPKCFEQADKSKSIAFMQAYNFAVIISVNDGLPIATHLPFVITEKEDNIILFSHLSKNNPQWQTFKQQEVLVVFSEPHAYISPKLYDKQQNVPTWNYIAVHAYGAVKILNSKEEKMKVLLHQMTTYEPDYLDQFKQLSEKYIDDLLEEIVAFEINITQLQAKEKLSQNKTTKERQNIKEHLTSAPDNTQSALGKYM